MTCDSCAVVVTLMLSERQAYALAQLCKRLSWDDAMSLSADEAEARAQINATDRLRAALEDAGILSTESTVFPYRKDDHDRNHHTPYSRCSSGS